MRTSTSPRSSPSRTAAAKSPATRWSNSRRRSSAHRSVSVLPRTRSSSVTYGSSATSTSTVRRVTYWARSSGRPGDRALLVQDGEEPVDGPADGPAQQLLLGGDVVVDRGLGDPGRLREVLHRGAVVPALVEDAHRHREQRLGRVRVAPAPWGAPRAPPPLPGRGRARRAAALVCCHARDPPVRIPAARQRGAPRRTDRSFGQSNAILAPRPTRNPQAGAAPEAEAQWKSVMPTLVARL